MPLTADWHRPVAAVLDYFGLDDVTLLGFSLGGCLVPGREERSSITRASFTSGGREVTP